MKKTILLSSVLFLGLTSCNDESLESGLYTQTLDVSINDIKSRVGFESGTGNFFWTSNDKIGVTTTTSTTSFVSMTLSSESGKSTGTFTGSMSGKPSGYAVYPYIGFENHSITAAGKLTYKFPDEYTYSNLDSEYGSKTGNSFNAPMWAKVTEGEGVFFDHLGGVICVTVNDLPVGNNQKFILKTTNQITGEFTVDLTVTSPKLVTSTSNSNNSVTINFSNTTADGTGVFYVPVPTGTYGKITAMVMNGEEEVGIGIWENQTVNQGSLKKATIGESSLEGGTATVYNVQTAGTLKDLLPDNYLSMTSLTVKGYLNGDDIKVIREMAGSNYGAESTEVGALRTLDISNATIVEDNNTTYLWQSIGNGQYTFKTENNVVGPYMFVNTKLEKVILPTNITVISDRAFYDCKNLTSINLPESITELGSTTFGGCSSLTNITLPSNLTTINGTFWGCSSLASIIIPNNVTTIENGSFSGCTALTNVTIPNGITTIELNAFYNCSSLSNVSIPNSVTNIGDFAFYGCNSLTSITLPATTIGFFAFDGCSSLTNITLGSNVSTINNFAFQDCTSLTKVEVKATVPPVIGANIFSGCNSELKIYVPAECLDDYKADTGWKDLNLLSE